MLPTNFPYENSKLGGIMLVTRITTESAQWLETTAEKYSKDLNIIVRLHPNEDDSLYRHCPHLRITKDSPDLAIALDGCDWVGSRCFTVLYDALLFKKPVWQFYADGWPELAKNWREGLALANFISRGTR